MYLVHQVTSSAVGLSTGSQPCVSSAAMCPWPPGVLLLLFLNIHLSASSTNRLIPNVCLNQTPSSSTVITKDTAAEQAE